MIYKPVSLPIQYKGKCAQARQKRKEVTMLFSPKEKGQTLVEYLVILAIVAVLVAGLMIVLPQHP